MTLHLQGIAGRESPHRDRPRDRGGERGSAPREIPGDACRSRSPTPITCADPNGVRPPHDVRHPLPHLDPVLVEIGPFAIRWYALAYIAGICSAAGARALRWRAGPPRVLTPPSRSTISWSGSTLGVILGGRLGYVLFYKPGYYLAAPAARSWRSGRAACRSMAACSACTSRCMLFARRRGIAVLAFGDVSRRWCRSACSSAASPTSSMASSGAASPTCPGRWSSRPAGPMPRHPSQLYQAVLEGLVLFVVLAHRCAHGRRAAAARADRPASSCRLRPGAHHRRVLPRARRAARLSCSAALTMGQLLSLPMLLARRLADRRARAGAPRSARRRHDRARRTSSPR